jgi:hypothetical protein
LRAPASLRHQGCCDAWFRQSVLSCAFGAGLDELTLYVDVSKMRFLRPGSVDD